MKRESDITIVFPSDFLNRRVIDPDLKEEYDSVIRCGQFNTVIFGNREWFDDERMILTEERDKPVRAIYRGWMMPPELYEKFCTALKNRGFELITPYIAYRSLHMFPLVYDLIKEDTAEIMLFPLHEQVDIEAVKKRFRRFMVKDYVKSVKGTSFPVFFDHDVTQGEFDAQMEVFYQYRGNLLTGGICIKEYLDLKRYVSKTNEWRAFICNGELLSLSRNSGQRGYAPEPPDALVKKYHLPSPFYTMDFAELQDGSWKIIEVGDGSVSGLSEGQDYDAFFRALYQCVL